MNDRNKKGTGILRKLYLLLVVALALGLPMAAFAGGSVGAKATLYKVDLDSGALSSVGMIGYGESVVGLAISTTEETTYALTTGGELVQFAAATPETIIDRQTISGVASDDWLVGIDFRPATGVLYAVSAGSQLYTLDTGSGAATAVGDGFSPELEGSVVGFDFNPTVDRIRVVVTTGQNLRLNPDTGEVGTNPDTGAPTIDGRLAFADGDENSDDSPKAVGAAYTNNVDGATTTELYIIEANNDVLATQDPPNDGVLNTDGDLGVDVGTLVGFDIAPSGSAYAAVTFDAPEMPDTGAGVSAQGGLASFAMLGLVTMALASAGLAFANSRRA